MAPCGPNIGAYQSRERVGVMDYNKAVILVACWMDVQRGFISCNSRYKKRLSATCEQLCHVFDDGMT